MDEPRILIIEDEWLVASDIQSNLEQLNYNVVGIAVSGGEALNKIQETHPDLILSDIVLQGEMDGIEVAEIVQKRWGIPIVYLTAYTNKAILERAKITEPYAYLVKPFDELELDVTIQTALYKHKMEKRLRESENRLASTLASITDGVIVIDAHQNIILINDIAFELTGSVQDNAVGKHINHIITLTCEYNKPIIFPYKDSKHPHPISNKRTAVLYRGDGMKIPVEICVSKLIANKDGKESNGYVLVISDITKRRRNELELEKNRQDLKIRNRIAEIFLTVSDEGMFSEVLDIVLKATESKFGVFGYLDDENNFVCPSLTREIWKECEITEKNIVFPHAKWTGIWGQSLMEKRSIFTNKDFVVPKGHIPINTALSVPILHRDKLIGNFIVGNKETGYNKKDQNFLEEIASFVAPVLNARLERDFQEKKRKIAEKERRELEKKVFRIQKMESIGTLAGGIAHDFNNILSAIIGYADLARYNLEESSDTIEYLINILKASKRAKELVRQILTFSRKDNIAKQPMQPSSVIKEALKLMRASLPTSIEIEDDIDADSGYINANPTSIHQVLINLCTNAFHAMENEKGKLTIQLRKIELSYTDVKNEIDVAEGAFIELTVGDSGTGMNPLTVERIFEPYYTTKEVGKGTGMGLALVHGIIKSCEGFIRVETEPGKGTAFHLFFPALQIQDNYTTDSKETPKTYPTGNERILVIDDEEVISELYKKFLQWHGYTVTTKNNSKEAFETFKASPEDFDLIITDQTMPFLTGSELAQKLLQIKPALPIILCTGYSSVISEKNAKDLGITKFLMKPINIGDLTITVRKVLDNPKPY